MNIRSVRLQNFMSHDSTVFKLPQRGLVSISGPNGAGKSAVIEAVSMSVWGKTMRGSAPWRDRERGSVALETDQVVLGREFNGSRVTSLWFQAGLEDPHDYDTVTKAQSALESVVGPWELWHRTHVFSSADAAGFTLATDAERKRLLERLLGLTWFDSALSAVREDLRAVEKRLAGGRAKVAQLGERLEGAERGRTAALEDIKQFKDLRDNQELVKEVQHLRSLSSEAREEVTALNRELESRLKDGAIEESEARRLRYRLQSLGDECDECGQPITDELRAKMMADIESREVAAKKARAAAKKQVAELRDQLADLREEYDALHAKEQARKTELSHLDNQLRQHNAVKKRLEELDTIIAGAELELDGIQEQAENDEVELAELIACEKILGLKGVRAQLLGSALSGVEEVANLWMHKLSKGAHVELRSYKEKKRGGSTDAISLSVVTGRGRSPYASASGGERRRVDVAVLFALAEVANGGRAHGEQGTLFFDEVFDALDDDGVSAVVDALRELAEVRPVVVISHAYLKTLEAAAHIRYRVEGGKVSSL